MPPTELTDSPVVGLGVPTSAQEHSEEPLLYSDGEPLESYWHVLQIPLLIQLMTWRNRDRRDFFAGGNMFLYFDPQSKKHMNFRGPDFFYVDRAKPKPPRKYWAVWEEGGALPDLIIELMSPSTRRIDLTTKLAIYERSLPTRDYVAYDPDTNEIHAWTRIDGRFVPLHPDENGRVHLASIDLWLGTWHGEYLMHEMNWLRFFENDGTMIETSDEHWARLADHSQRNAEDSEKQATAAEKHAADEKTRADALAAEVARLKAELEKLS